MCVFLHMHACLYTFVHQSVHIQAFLLSICILIASICLDVYINVCRKQFVSRDRLLGTLTSVCAEYLQETVCVQGSFTGDTDMDGANFSQDSTDSDAMETTFPQSIIETATSSQSNLDNSNNIVIIMHDSTGETSTANSASITSGRTSGQLLTGQTAHVGVLVAHDQVRLLLEVSESK